jgi:lipopolysaccharide transport system ATP-binding protein
VKHYSSGMRVRLAFAVAAHLDPEILLVDEVLAVGDARFQRKCLNKMQDVGQEGRTVLFVSHNMASITRLCSRTILLDEGRIIQDGPSHKVVTAYLQSGLGTTAAREWPDAATAPGGQVARLRAVRAINEDGEVTDAMDIRRPIRLEMTYDVLQAGHILLPHFHIHNEEGVKLFVTNDLDPEWRKRPRPKGHYVSRATIPGNLLSEGTLFVQAAMITLEPIIHQFMEQDAIAFQVIDSLDGNSARGDYAGDMRGLIRPRLEWKTMVERSNGR